MPIPVPRGKGSRGEVERMHGESGVRALSRCLAHMSKLWKLIRKIAHKFDVSFAGAHPSAAPGPGNKIRIMSRRLAAPSSLATLPPFSWPDNYVRGERADSRELIAFVSGAGMRPFPLRRFLTYELPAKITSMPYIQAAPPRWAEEPMVIKFWEHLRSTQPPCLSLFLCSSYLAHGGWLITATTLRRKKASFVTEWFAGVDARGVIGKEMHKNFYESFSLRRLPLPSPSIARESRVKREKTRDIARSRSEEGEVLFFSFFLRVTYGVGEFFCSPGLWFTFNSGWLVRNRNH